jgi:hypothetical protein
MAAQALCKPAPKDATKLIGDFKSGFYGLSQDMKYGESVLLIIWPQFTFSPWNIWDPDINYPLIPIVEHAYLLLTLSSMHALSSPPGISHLTHRTQLSRYNPIGAYSQGTDAQLTPAMTAQRRAPSLVYNPHLL